MNISETNFQCFNLLFTVFQLKIKNAKRSAKNIFQCQNISTLLLSILYHVTYSCQENEAQFDFHPSWVMTIWH